MLFGAVGVGLYPLAKTGLLELLREHRIGTEIFVTIATVIAMLVLGIAAALLRWIGPVQAALIHLGPDILVFVNSVKLVRIRIRLPDEQENASSQ